VCTARDEIDAMMTTEVTLRVYDLRCDEETKRRASKTRHPFISTRRRDDDDDDDDHLARGGRTMTDDDGR